MILNLGAATDSFILRYASATDNQYTFTDNHITTIGTDVGFILETTYKPGTAADNDVFALFQLGTKNSASTLEPWAELKFTALDVTDGTEETKMEILLLNDGAAPELVWSIDTSTFLIKHEAGFDLDLGGNDIDNVDDLTFNEGGAAPTPATDDVALYAKAGGKLFYKADDGVEKEIAVV